MPENQYYPTKEDVIAAYTAKGDESAPHGDLLITRSTTANSVRFRFEKTGGPLFDFSFELLFDASSLYLHWEKWAGIHVLIVGPYYFVPVSYDRGRNVLTVREVVEDGSIRLA